MGKFGEELKKERESRGIKIDKITEATKISSIYLKALETGKFDQLPGGVFNKGIVRGYAQVVGLDEKIWINRFMSAYAESGQVKDDDVYWVEFAENVGKSRPHQDLGPHRLRLNWPGVAVLVVLITVLGWFFWHFVGGRFTAQAAVSQSSIVAAK